jgi:hypothetical protein
MILHLNKLLISTPLIPLQYIMLDDVQKEFIPYKISTNTANVAINSIVPSYRYLFLHTKTPDCIYIINSIVMDKLAKIRYPTMHMAVN